MKQEEVSASIEESGPELKFVDILLVLARYKRALVMLPMAAVAVGVVISFVLPPAYRATTTLLPPQQSQSSAAALLSQLGGAAGALASAGGIKNPSDMYVGMFKSRTVADRLIQRFDLLKVYDERSLDDARSVLEKRSAISAAKDGMITVTVEDGDKKRSADLANAYVEELVKLTKVLAVTEAGQRRLFYEQQLEAAKNNLANAEASLKTSLDRNGVISVDTESRAIIETSGRLRAALSAKEIQLDSMKAYLTPENPEYLKAQKELSSLRAEFERLRNGRQGDEDSTGDPRNSGLQNIKALRDLKYYQMLYELLARQFELARLDEARDASVIQVLDPAVPPEHKFKPKRSVIVVLAAIFGVFAGLGYVVFAEKMRPAAGSADSDKWKQLRAMFGNRI